MRKIWELIRYDARRVFTNVISLVVCVGMIVVPCFYAWFNIAGSWDPYGNTKNLKVAVANSDDGYASELIPVSLNMGERMTSELRESTSIGYTVTSEEDAVEGVRSGKYYAAVVFPENFTRDLLSGFADSASAPRVSFYQNDAGAFMVSMAEKGEKADVVFMDPPRAGSDEAFLSSVVTLSPKKVVYVSCNPETLARDLRYLTKHGYKAEEAWGYDMFAWSEHVETVCLLTQKKA